MQGAIWARKQTFPELEERRIWLFKTLLIYFSLKMWFLFPDGTWAGKDCFDPEGEMMFSDSKAYLQYNMTLNDTINPVESYWK